MKQVPGNDTEPLKEQETEITEHALEESLELEGETIPSSTPILKYVFSIPSNIMRAFSLVPLMCSLLAGLARHHSLGRVHDLSAQHPVHREEDEHRQGPFPFPFSCVGINAHSLFRSGSGSGERDCGRHLRLPVDQRVHI